MRISMRGGARLGAEQQAPQRRRGVTIFAGAILIIGGAILLWINRGFADYALTGSFWNQTDGTVMDAARTSTPTIEFTTPDGATHEFREDYIILCQGKRSFCFIRDFDPGQQVPVVYNPGSPEMAYVHDWALISIVIAVFLETAAELFFMLMMVVMVRRRPIRATVRFGGDEDEPQTD